MNLLFWPSIFLAFIFFNYEIHKRFELKRNAIEDSFVLEWNKINIPSKYVSVSVEPRNFNE